MKKARPFQAFPENEPGQILGTPGYDHAKAHEEAIAFIRLIIREIGSCPEGSNWSIHTNHNELGAYYTIVYNYDTLVKDQRKYARIIKERLPKEWDKQAIDELGSILR